MLYTCNLHNIVHQLYLNLKKKRNDGAAGDPADSA